MKTKTFKSIGLVGLFFTCLIYCEKMGEEKIMKNHIERAEYILNSREHSTDLSSSIEYILFGFDINKKLNLK